MNNEVSIDTKKILVTCALPYANGPIHLGHILEHIQADIWVRFQRMLGNNVYFICADDAHGTPIMLKAQQLKISPEQLIESAKKEHQQDFADFHISYDNYHSTHSNENLQFSHMIYRRLNKNGFIKSRTISQLFDPEKKIFLPDRFIRGTCPNCLSPNQYGDNCESCGATYNPTELIQPRSTFSGVEPVLKESEHFFFNLSAFSDSLQKWIHSGSLQEQVVNKIEEWFSVGLKEWDITRDAPYFGFEIPDKKDKYFYVWLDAPIGYIGTFKNLCDRLKTIKFDDFWQLNSTAELYHFIGKDIIYFHSLFWPAILEGSQLRKPTSIFAHGYVTINGKKMSKSRGTFITARNYLNHFDSDCLRYYYATKLFPGIEDIDLNLEDFVQRVNTDIVNKLVNLASRNAGFITKKFSGKLAKRIADPILYQKFINARDNIKEAYLSREIGRAIREIMSLVDVANRYVDQQAPWKICKEIGSEQKLHEICSMGIELFRILMTYLKPVLPSLTLKVEKFLRKNLIWQEIEKPLLNHEIENFKKLFNRIEMNQIHEMMAHETNVIPNFQDNELPIPISKNNIVTFNEFSKIDLRVARIIQISIVENADKLLQLILDLGKDVTCQVFSKIRASYPDPSVLIGKLVIVTANLAPRKMQFGTSEGIVLTSTTTEKETFLITLNNTFHPGDIIR